MDKKESGCKAFINVAFKDRENKDWVKTAKRLNDFFHGKWYDSKSNKSRFTINSAFSMVNLILPNFVLQQPEIRCNPLNPRYMVKKIDGTVIQRDALTQSRIRGAAINHIYKKISAINEDRKAVQDALFYPFGICKVGYSYKTIIIDDNDYIQEDTPFRRRINPEDFGWHPLATGPDDSDKLVHRIFTTKGRLRDNEDFKNIKDLTSTIPQNLKEKLKDCDKKDFIILYEVHDQEKDEILTYAGDERKLFTKKKNPYDFNGSHFSMIKFSGCNDDFEGIPMLAMIEDEMRAKNEVMTMIIEHMRKFPGQGFYDLGSMDEDDIQRILNSEQGSLHGVPDTSKLKFTNPLTMGSDYFNILNLLDTQMDRTLGVPDFQRLTGASRKSATEASFIQGDATVRRNYYLKLVKDFVLDGVKKVAALQAQYQDEKDTIAASGEIHEPFEYSKEDIQGDYIYDFDIDNMASANQSDMTNLINLLNVMAQNEAFKPALAQLSPTKTIKKLFKYVNLNVEDLLTDEIENTIHVPPDRENELAIQGKPMPQPKVGEDYDFHIKKHRAKLAELSKIGQFNQQIAEHIASTEILKMRELGTEPTPPQQPQSPQVGLGGASQLPPPAGLQGPNQLI